MTLITGGAYQGKLEYVRNTFCISKVTDGSVCDLSEVTNARCISAYHELVKRLINSEIEPIVFTENLCNENPNMIVIINEIGSGIIPFEKEERLWREAVGRCGCILAKKADIVIRVMCGIPHFLKGEFP